jgi:acyl-CoA thioesterase FadM
MADWIETYRGAVPPWQCDVTEHFTVAYYFDRLEEATATLAEELGLSDVLRTGGFPRGINARFVSELRAGASFHVESAALGVDANGLRLGHRFLDSSKRQAVTWFEEHWDLSAAPLSPEKCRDLAPWLATWDGPVIEPKPEPAGTEGFIPTARGRVKPVDLDADGRFAVGSIVHRFSNASGQFGAAIGFDATFMERNRRGFSTFELALKISAPLRLDEPYLVRTGIGHLGNSSLRMIHRMTNPRNGAAIASLGQFGVNLDLDARRPAGWPEDIRNRAAALVVTDG